MNIESVWDYPRPPRLEPVPERLRIVLGGVTIANTAAGLRILETSHPPVYYLPREAFAPGIITASGRGPSFCEFKGLASYWNIGDEQDAAWSYERPVAAYGLLKGRLAVYASRMDECWVGEEQVQAQAGDFYGGWITSNLRGPFKGAPGTRGW